MRLESLVLSEQSMRCSFEWNDVEDIACVGKPEFYGKVLDIGGWVQKRQVSIEFRLELLPDGVGLPVPNDEILYKNSAGATAVKYKIKSLKNWYNATMELECEDANS